MEGRGEMERNWEGTDCCINHVLGCRRAPAIIPQEDEAKGFVVEHSKHAVVAELRQ